MPQLEDLPNELMLQVISYLPQKDLASFMRTNRTFQCLVQPILYHTIEISHQSLPQLYSLCGQLGKFDKIKKNKIRDHVRVIEIDTARLDLSTPFQIPDRDREKTEKRIDSLLMPYVAANSVTLAIPYDPEAREKWRGALFAVNPLNALLAYIAAESAKLESLKLNLSGYFQIPSVTKLLYYKIRADLQCKRATFPKLRHLQIGSVQDIDLPVFALSELCQLRIHFLDDDSPLEIPVFENNNLSHLHVLDFYYIKDASSKARKLFRDHEFPYLRKLRILDENPNMNGRYHKIPKMVRDHCPMLDTLVTDAVYVEDENSPFTIQQPKTYSLSRVKSFRTHVLFLADNNGYLRIDWLERLLPVNARRVEISGITIQSMQTMVENHTAGQAMETRLPTYLESIRLIFDFDVARFVSLSGRLHLVEPVLHALKAKLNAEGVALEISVRRIGDIAELYDEHYMGDETGQVYDDQLGN